MTNDAWLRFQKIMHYGDFIQPVDDSFRLKTISPREVEIGCNVKREVCEVYNYAEQVTGVDWIIKTGYPEQRKDDWKWVLIR